MFILCLSSQMSGSSSSAATFKKNHPMWTKATSYFKLSNLSANENQKIRQEGKPGVTAHHNLFTCQMTVLKFWAAWGMILLSFIHFYSKQQDKISPSWGFLEVGDNIFRTIIKTRTQLRLICSIKQNNSPSASVEPGSGLLDVNRLKTPGHMISFFLLPVAISL